MEIKTVCTLRNKNFKVSDAMNTYMEDKISKLRKYSESLSNVQYIVKIKDVLPTEKNLKVTVSVDSSFIHSRAEAIHTDFYTAFDEACSKLERSMRKQKEKTNKKQRKALNKIVENLENTKNIDTKKKPKMKEVEIKPMSIEEAILQMDLMDYAFFMFLEAKSLTYQTVYKRSNGDYGVLIGIEVW